MFQADMATTSFHVPSTDGAARYRGSLFLYRGQWWIDHSSMHPVDSSQQSDPPTHDVGVTDTEHAGRFLEGQSVEFELAKFEREDGVCGIGAVNLVAAIGTGTPPLAAPRSLGPMPATEDEDEFEDMLIANAQQKRWRRRTIGFMMVVTAFALAIGLFVANRSISELSTVIIACSALGFGIGGVYTVDD
jgi:hypothetical protein